MRGERLNQLVSLDEFKLATGAAILSPYIPLLFMGQEYGETAPFQFFVSHSDPGLVEAVRKGRREEYGAFHWKGEPPDPPDEQTYLRSKLQWKLRNEGQHRLLWQFTRELLRLRRELPALRCLSKEGMEVRCDENSNVLHVRRVAFCGNPLIPVVVGVGRVLQFDNFQPGILPRRLIEMSVDANVSFHLSIQGWVSSL